jgi:hypothetical protein
MTDTLTIPDTIEDLEYDEPPQCECELMFADGSRQTCDNPATWYATCKGCADHGYYCAGCRIKVLTYWTLCHICLQRDATHWVKL